MIRGAVLGSPITHSLSPRLHRAAFTFLGLEAGYEAIDVSAGTLSTFFSERCEEFDYFSLTMPLKEEVLSLPVTKSPLLTQIQSANTLYRTGASWSLTSTDGSGFIAALAYANLHKFERVLILGAGGTSRAVAGALDSVSNEIHVLGRSSVRAPALESAVQIATFEYIRWGIDFDFNSYDLVVNTTPAGAADLLVEKIRGGLRAVLFDVIYKPWPTVLASGWKDSGAQVINGLELLIYQGIDQLEIILKQDLDRQPLAQHLRKALKE